MALSPQTAQKLQTYLGQDLPVPDSGILGDNTQNQGLAGLQTSGILSQGFAPTNINNFGPSGAIAPAGTNTENPTPTNTTTATLPGANQISTTPTGPTQGILNTSNNSSNSGLSGLQTSGPQSLTPTAPTAPTPGSPVPPLGTAPAATAPSATGINTTPGTPNNTATQLNADQLTDRTIDPNELVANQLTGILGTNSPYVQGARDRAIRSANTRGLLNSTLAGTGGEEAAIAAAMPIATADAATYGKAGDYNTALKNQGYMYNVDAENNFKKLNLQIGADKEMQEKAINAQLTSAGISASASANSAASNLEAARISAETSRLNAMLNAETSTNNQNAQNAASVYNQKLSLANNIIQNLDLSPDYKKQLINGLGPEFAFLAAGVFTDGSMAGDLNNTGGWVEGSTRTVSGQRQVFRGGKWEVES